MANQDDADRAWAKALAEHPELTPDDEGSDLLNFARDMFGSHRGRTMHLDNLGNVVVEFQITYPFPLDGHMESVGCSFVIDRLILTRGGEGAAMRIEQDVQRQILTHFLPAVEQKALDLGARTASTKLAAIRGIIDSYPTSGHDQSTILLLGALLHVLDS